MTEFGSFCDRSITYLLLLSSALQFAGVNTTALPFLLPWRGLASSIWEARREFMVLILFCVGLIVGMF
jgi:hypothetical protein